MRKKITIPIGLVLLISFVVDLPSFTQPNLHIDNNPVVLFGKDSTIEGSKLMWIPSQAALQSGYEDRQVWRYENIGLYSTAVGNRTGASGEYSTLWPKLNNMTHSCFQSMKGNNAKKFTS